MIITYQQATRLLKSVSAVVPDTMTCDDCYSVIAELAEAEQSGRDLTEQLQAVRIHLSQCPCCAYEYEALCEAIDNTGTTKP